MAIQKINLGTEPHGVGGDSYRTANEKINSNFEEVGKDIKDVLDVVMTGDFSKTAYDIAVKNGFVGSESEWLESLRGDQGPEAKSVYDIAVSQGFTGSEEDWLNYILENSETVSDLFADADSLEQFINGSDSETVLTRLSAEYPTLQKAIKQMFENGGLPATPFETKALMEASELADGAYAVVTNDEDSVNGLYVKKDGVFINSEYDLRRQIQKEMITVFDSVEDRDNSTLPIGSYALIGDTSSEVSLDTPNLVIYKKMGEGLWENTSFNVEKYVFKYIKQWIEQHSSIDGTDIAGAITDGNYNVAASIDSSGKVTVELLNPVEVDADNYNVSNNLSSPFPFSFIDKDENVSAAVTTKGSFYTPYLEGDGWSVSIADSLQYKYALTDNEDNVLLGVTNDGRIVNNVFQDTQPSEVETSNIKSFDTQSCEKILFIGDSYTASHYTLKDKAYISVFGNLSNYRVENFGVSGNDALDMNQRLVENAAYFSSLSPKDINAKYAIIATYTNDTFFRVVDLEYYRQNLCRLVESVLSLGIQPLIFSQFGADATAIAVLMNVATQYGVPFIDGHSLNREIGLLKKGIFHQGHPGTRSNIVFWHPMLKAVEKLPNPREGIKIFRVRDSSKSKQPSELLYTGIFERYQNFKELSVDHYRLSDATAQYYDELDGENVYKHVRTNDEYRRLKTNSVSFSGYALVEVTLDSTAQNISSLSIDLPTSGTVYVRDFLDVPSNIRGKSTGLRPDNPEYLDNYNNPRGAWKPITELEFTQNELKGLMLYDTMQILVVGDSFTIGEVQVSYKSEGFKPEKVVEEYKTNGINLLENSDFRDLSHWNLVGSPSTIVPIDVYNAPRKPDDRTSPVGQVIQVDGDNYISRTFELPKYNTEYLVTIWCRYFPKAFLDNSKYNLDPEQVIDYSTGLTFPEDSEITVDTPDAVPVIFSYKLGESDTSNVHREFTHNYWMPVQVRVRSLDSTFSSSTLSMTVKGEGATIQIAKINIEEIV